MSDRQSRRRVLLVVYAYLGAWYLASLVCTLANLFLVGPDEVPWLLLGFTFLPGSVLVVAYHSSAALRDLVSRLDLRLLTAFQATRAVGLGFLALYQVRALSALFALVAGWGDIVAAVTAPFVALVLMERATLPRRTIIAWNVFGIADFAAALSANFLSSNTALGVLRGELDSSVMAIYPLVSIPTFFLPLLVLFHLIVIARMRTGTSS